MSKSSNSRQSLGPLSVGNVISAALQIYRDRFKVYYILALQAYLWFFPAIVLIIVIGFLAAITITQREPALILFVIISSIIVCLIALVYGSAKFASILGLISRLVFSEISERPETVSEARRHIEPRLWTFLLAGILFFLIFFGAILGVGIVLTIVFGFLVSITPSESALGISLIIILGIIAFIGLLFGDIWLYSRLSLVELPIAIEDQGDAGAAIGRSWKLTQRFVFRIQLIFFVAFLITIPVSIVIQIGSNILQTILTPLIPQNSGYSSLILSLIYFILVIAFSVASNALIIPFWQAIKAVIYYDLRSRKEGIDLQLRDSNS